MSPGRHGAPWYRGPTFDIQRDVCMTLHIHLWPVLSILAGVLILVQPKLLNYVVAIYLILIGVFGPGGLIH
jgi:hypothetical protein